MAQPQASEYHAVARLEDRGTVERLPVHYHAIHEERRLGKLRYQIETEAIKRGTTRASMTAAHGPTLPSLR